ncbi:MAG: Calvin cycle protein CP12 [Cyanobacteria bacterium P01_C01_bin.120]
MVYITLASAETTSTSTTPTALNLETRLKAALEHARRLTEMDGISPIDLAIAWETVEELQTAKGRKSATSPSAFTQYCAANPDAPECRIYDC